MSVKMIRAYDTIAGRWLRGEVPESWLKTFDHLRAGEPPAEPLEPGAYDGMNITQLRKRAETRPDVDLTGVRRKTEVIALFEAADQAAREAAAGDDEHPND